VSDQRNDPPSRFVKKACLALLVTSYADYLVRPSPLLDGPWVVDVCRRINRSIDQPPPQGSISIHLLTQSPDPILHPTTHTHHHGTPDASVRLHAHEVERPFWDKTVCSSLVYALAGLYSLWLGQHALGTLQIVTCGGSTFYHLRKEAAYFNLDNTFASSLLLLTLYAAGAQYDDWHTAWHVVSGLSTMVVAHFFQRQWPDLQCGGPNFALMPDLPVVPTLCVVGALLLNIAGNAGGIMPVQ